MISNYDVAAAPDTYRPVPGEYTVNFHRKTSVKKIGDVPAIPMFQFNLKTFEETRARLGDVVTLIGNNLCIHYNCQLFSYSDISKYSTSIYFSIILMHRYYFLDVVGKLKDYTHIQTAKSGKKSLDIVLADKRCASVTQLQ